MQFFKAGSNGSEKSNDVSVKNESLNPVFDAKNDVVSLPNGYGANESKKSSKKSLKLDDQDATVDHESTRGSHKKKKKQKTKRSEDDSIILLSDASCNNSAIIDEDESVKEPRTEVIPVAEPDGKEVDEKAETPKKKKKSKKSHKGKEVLDAKEVKTRGMETVEKCLEIENKLVDKVQNEVKSPMIKKTSLKVKDMVNLLKEIQSDNEKIHKKKKHKKKHKHSRKDDKVVSDTHEISCVDEVDGSPVTENVKVPISNEERDKKKKSKHKEKHNDKNETKHLKTPKHSDNGLTHVKDKSKGETTERDKDCVSYKSFKKSLDEKSKGTEDHSHEENTDNNPKEMSYSEYLEKLEKESENDRDVIVDIEKEADPTKEVLEAKHNDLNEENEINVKNKDKNAATNSKKPSNFFSLMTSTPERSKGKIEKNKVIKVENGKIKTDKKKSKRTDESNGDYIKIDETNSVLEIEDNEQEENDAVSVKKEQEKATENTMDCKKLTAGGKKTQATLSFGKGGLGYAVSKPIVETVKKDENVPVTGQVKSVSKRGRAGRPPKVVKTENEQKAEEMEIDKQDTSDNVFATPVVGKKGRKRKQEVVNESETSTDGDEKRRSLRKRYKVEAFQMDADNKTPIKIKLKRFVEA